MKILFCFLVLICTLYLDFGQTEKILKEESELRPAWGLKFDFLGKMLHGLNKYYLIVGIKIPNFIFEVRKLNTDFDFCEIFGKYNNTPLLHQTCNRTWPVYMASLEREQEYREQINQIVQKQLPAVIPGFEMANEDSEEDLDFFWNDKIHLKVDEKGNIDDNPIRENRSAKKPNPYPFDWNSRRVDRYEIDPQPTPFGEAVSRINTERNQRQGDREFTPSPVDSWFEGLTPTVPSNENKTLRERFKNQNLPEQLVGEPELGREPLETAEPITEPITETTDTESTTTSTTTETVYATNKNFW